MRKKYGQLAFSFFLPEEELLALEPLGSGLINDTWLAEVRSGAKYVLQRLNTTVFPEPGLIQENICRVTEHLRTRSATNTECTFFRVFRNAAGQSAYIDKNGDWWRLLSYIKNAQSLNAVTEPDQAWQIGAALSSFHQLIADLPPSSLADPLPGFHDTPLHLARYDAVLPVIRNAEAEDCREFIKARRTDAALLENSRKQGILTRQPVHGDPKVNNFLFSADKKRVVSLVDLDTVRPGPLIYDLGDCLRSCCNPLGEEVQDPNDIVFDRDLFSAVLAGYLSRAADLLAPEDRRLIVDSARLISFELGIRFYSDYLAGNPYFKVDYPEQNLFRARVQFALVRSIEAQYDVLTTGLLDKISFD